MLDYARAISRWSYSDLQRQVAAARGEHGNVPFELVRACSPQIEEHVFVDATATAMREGRFLLLVAGDGIREDVGAMAELINRNAALGFSFGLVEIALYGLDDGGLAIQPRVVARTQIIERTVVVVRGSDGIVSTADADDDSYQTLASAAEESGTGTQGESPRQAAYRKWWQPVIDARLDDPDQEPPVLYWPNHLRAALPWPGTWILVYALDSGRGRLCVRTAGRSGADQELLQTLEPMKEELLAELPPGTIYRRSSTGPGSTYAVEKDGSEFENDDQRREWLATMLNAFVNTLRPRAKRLVAAK